MPLDLSLIMSFIKVNGANISAFGTLGNDNTPLAPSINLDFYAKL
jgi:hypothetical protein